MQVGNHKELGAPLTERRSLLPFVLITSLFFLWAFGVNLNDILIPHFKRAFALSDFQSSFIQVAFFGGYFLAAFPAGRLMERIGYKRGILCGLGLCSLGALLFLPASRVGIFEFFLLALFVMACGQSFLEVAANPYVTILGPEESAERRLNFAQSFNSVGAVASPLLGSALILKGVEYTSAQVGALSPAQLHAYQSAEASTVKFPYLVIAGIFLVMAGLISWARLPDIIEHQEKAAGRDAGRIFAQRHLVKGVIAQFFYVGAQVGVASFVVRFVQHTMPGTAARTSAFYLLGHQLGFMLGRFTGSQLMKIVAPARLLMAFAAGSVLCAILAIQSHGIVPIYAIVVLGFFHSIMFPTIFALSIKNLGALTKRGSSLLVMAIMGGAVFPAIMGKISDKLDIQTAFIVPVVCYVYILYFAMFGYKPQAASAKQDEARELEGMAT